MKSVMDVFGDSLDKLSEYVSADINNFLNNYYHNAINRELIADETDSTYYREVKTGWLFRPVFFVYLHDC